jgi:hypothetical protein
MRKLLIMLIAFPVCSFGQDKKGIGIGFKAGLNFANVTNASSINSTNSTGFMFAVFMSPPSKKIFSMRTEIVFSRQGYNYKTNTNTGTVDLNYIMMPTLTGLNIGKFAQIQFGMQTSYLLNAKADSSGQSGSGQYEAMMGMMNRFNYGAAVGLEIYPYKGIIIGARYNLSFNQTYKEFDATSMPTPSFIPSFDAKNNVVQFFLGYKF